MKLNQFPYQFYNKSMPCNPSNLKLMYWFTYLHLYPSKLMKPDKFFKANVLYLY